MPEKKTLTYHCRICGEPFEADQGSRRTLCGDCLVKQVTKKK